MVVVVDVAVVVASVVVVGSVVVVVVVGVAAVVVVVVVVDVVVVEVVFEGQVILAAESPASGSSGFCAWQQRPTAMAIHTATKNFFLAMFLRS